MGRRQPAFEHIIGTASVIGAANYHHFNEELLTAV